MKPRLFKREPDPVVLEDSNGVILKDSNGKTLEALGDWRTARDFTSNHGLGILADTIRCEISEERNGEYELEMEYPVSGYLYGYIENRCIIYAKDQPFRVYEISRPINGVISIRARHISYDLTGVPSAMFTSPGSVLACAAFMAYPAIKHPFTISTDIISGIPFTVNAPSSVRSWFGGQEGSLVDVYGGEWLYDGYKCTLKENRGKDNGVKIKYGLNMTDFQQEENISNMWTAVLPYWKDQTTGEMVSSYILYADGDFDFQKVLSVDMTQEFPVKPTLEELVAAGRRYIKANNIGIPEVNITVDWVPTMDKVELCDTVTVVFEKMNIEATAKCVKAVYDVLRERYTELQIGSIKPTIADNIAYLNKKAGYYGS